LRRAGLRTAIVFAVLAMAYYLGWGQLNLLSWIGPAIAVPFAVGVLAGCAIGYVVSRKLVEDSGLEGKHIVLPVAGLLLAAVVGPCVLAARLHGGSVAMLVIPSAGLILWSVAIAVFRIMTAK
jgi:hypothetical protein